MNFRSTAFRVTVCVLFLVFAATAGYAQSTDQNSSTSDDGPFAKTEPMLPKAIGDELSRLGDRKLSDLSANELTDIAGRLSVADQADAYIAKARYSSYFIAGMGHFAIQEPGYGFLFASLDVALVGGTLLGAYALLPASLKFDALDPFSSSYSNIESAWKGASFLSLLPSIAVLVGGEAVRILYVNFVAAHAAHEARLAIDEGRVTFEAKPYIELGKMIGFGLSFR